MRKLETFFYKNLKTIYKPNSKQRGFTLTKVDENGVLLCNVQYFDRHSDSCQTTTRVSFHLCNHIKS